MKYFTKFIFILGISLITVDLKVIILRRLPGQSSNDIEVKKFMQNNNEEENNKEPEENKKGNTLEDSSGVPAADLFPEENKKESEDKKQTEEKKKESEEKKEDKKEEEKKEPSPTPYIKDDTDWSEDSEIKKNENKGNNVKPNQDESGLPPFPEPVSAHIMTPEDEIARYWIYIFSFCLITCLIMFVYYGIKCYRKNPIVQDPRETATYSTELQRPTATEDDNILDLH
ncbi:MAG: hypothetical protein MJ252_26335 [archaeon]|nr:hypothetical protein [archaeon]